MDNVPSEMLRGHIDTIILLSLLNSDKHTGQIKEEIESRSDGKFELKQGTFYSCLQRIVKQGYVTEYRVSTPEGRKKFYQLTEKGKIYIDENKDRWCSSRSLIDTLIQTPSAMAELSVPSAQTQQVKDNSKPMQQEESSDDEISPEDTLKQFLDGETPTQTDLRESEESKDTAATVKTTEIKADTEEKHKEVKPGENYDIFSYMDNTQSFPIDEEDLKAETAAAKQATQNAETVSASDSPIKDEKIIVADSAALAKEESISSDEKRKEIAVTEVASETDAAKPQESHDNSEKFAEAVEKQDEKTEYLSDEKTATREYKTVLARLSPKKRRKIKKIPEKWFTPKARM